jgi:hypothetical protein
VNRRIYVRLGASQVEALVRLAETQKRHPADQAALILERALARQTKKEVAAK